MPKQSDHAPSALELTIRSSRNTKLSAQRWSLGLCSHSVLILEKNALQRLRGEEKVAGNGKKKGLLVRNKLREKEKQMRDGRDERAERRDREKG